MHSPLPWSTDNDEVLSADGRTVAHILSTLFEPAQFSDSSDAALIVKAVNHHAELVEALQWAKSALDMSYTAVERGCYEEALLHLGANEARLAKLLVKING